MVLLWVSGCRVWGIGLRNLGDGFSGVEFSIWVEVPGAAEMPQIWAETRHLSLFEFVELRAALQNTSVATSLGFMG